jgi:hypothetical protein
MGLAGRLAGVSLGRELRALAALSEPHRFGAAWHRLRSENSVTTSPLRVQTAPSHSK